MRFWGELVPLKVRSSTDVIVWLFIAGKIFGIEANYYIAEAEYIEGEGEEEEEEDAPPQEQVIVITIVNTQLANL